MTNPTEYACLQAGAVCVITDNAGITTASEEKAHSDPETETHPKRVTAAGRD